MLLVPCPPSPVPIAPRHLCPSWFLSSPHAPGPRSPTPPQALGLGSVEFVESWTDARGVLHVKLATRPRLDSLLPRSAAAQLTAERLELVDVVSYDPQLLQGPTYTLHTRSELPLLADTVRALSTRGCA